MTLVYFFYILRDSGELMRGFVKRYLPESMHAFVAGRSEKIVRILGRFVEGFFLTSSVVFVLTLLLLLVAGVRMAFLLALVAALLNIIPVIGFWVSTALVLVIALASGMQARDVLVIGAGLAAINIFEGNILQPKIIGRKVGLHPVVAILSVAIFGEILGFFGYILGIPLAAVLTSEWEEYLTRRRSRKADQA
jgi:predicted PurR-regulated permease PerM